MNRAPFLSHRRDSARGFTLVEMVITLTVFVLLSAAIFGIITGVLESASTLQDNQNRGDQTMALRGYLRKQLGAMTSQAGLISYRRGDGEGLVQNGIIFGTDNFLTAIDAKVQANGLYTLRLANYSPDGAIPDTGTFDHDVMDGDPSLSWRPLLQDVKTVVWKFQDLNNPEWLDHWDGMNNKPNLVEVSVQMAGDLRPSVMDFWIPHITNSAVVPTPTVP